MGCLMTDETTVGGIHEPIHDQPSVALRNALWEYRDSHKHNPRTHCCEELHGIKMKVHIDSCVIGGKQREYW